MKESTYAEFAVLYCDTQVQTPGGLANVLHRQLQLLNPDGWFIARCIMLDSSRLGTRVILPFGGTATHPVVPDGTFSPRGMASDISEAEAWTPTASLLQWRAQNKEQLL